MPALPVLRSLRTSAVHRDIIGTCRATVGAIGADTRSVFGALIVGYARKLCPKELLIPYAIVGIKVLKNMDFMFPVICLVMAFLLLFVF
ncbi:unnamed protein product [Oppiella nova]|uniref:Uncharacterized protein n=1 Tax=Oppiella nova TaxID=334625 RepID=A0A7R9MBS1_9ACAR|nr:unnamed protein product [Oppiella nova]CAG2174469.1 unnamed protein product [Oppiella nova]